MSGRPVNSAERIELTLGMLPYLADGLSVEETLKNFTVHLDNEGVTVQEVGEQCARVGRVWPSDILEDAARVGASWHSLLEVADHVRDGWELDLAPICTELRTWMARGQWPSMNWFRKRVLGHEVGNHRLPGEQPGQGKMAV